MKYEAIVEVKLNIEADDREAAILAVREWDGASGVATCDYHLEWDCKCKKKSLRRQK